MVLSASLGFAGGALAARLAALRLYLVPFSIGFLGLGYYLAYWKRFGGRRQRVILWIATGFTIVVWLTHYVFSALVG